MRCYSCHKELERGEFTVRNLFHFERVYLNLQQNYVILCKKTKNNACISFFEKKYKEAVEYEHYKDEDRNRMQQIDD